MPDYKHFEDIAVELDEFVATVEIRRGPHNFFNNSLIEELADAFEALDADPACRAIVLASEGKSFCAGAQLGGGGGERQRERAGEGSGSSAFCRDSGELYRQAIRLFRTATPLLLGPRRSQSSCPHSQSCP